MVTEFVVVVVVERQSSSYFKIPCIAEWYLHFSAQAASSSGMSECALHTLNFYISTYIPCCELFLDEVASRVELDGYSN